MNPQPKTKPFRSKKFLAHVRSLDCCECEWPADLGCIEAHHIKTGGTSTKCGDDLTVPLCSINARGCHPQADKSPDSADKYTPIAARIFVAYTNR